MRKQAKFVAVLSAAALLAVGASMTAFAATPHWDMEDGEWVYLDRNGDKVVDVWKKSNGQWYYLDSDGYMAKDMVVEDDNDAYYVGSDGARVTNAWVSMDNDDLLDDDEEPESIDTVWMFFDGSGKAIGFGENEEVVKKLSYGDGQSAYFMFNTDGYMLSGWKDRNGDLYYLGDQNEGWARTGWQQLEVNIELPVFQSLDEDDDGETEWFYFKPNGKAYKNTTQGYNGRTYVFDEYGRMLDLWTYKDGSPSSYTNNASSSTISASGSKAAFYREDEGGRDKNWIWAYPSTDYEEYDDDQYWFWLNSKGIPIKAEAGAGSAKRIDDNTDSDTDLTDPEYSGKVVAKVIKNNTYLFNSKGVMLQGLFALNSVDRGNGELKNGLYLFDKSGYPSSNSGKMVTNRKVKIDVNGEDKTYYFSKNGWAYTSAVISSTVYDKNGQLVDDFGDGSTYELVDIEDITDSVGGLYVLRGKTDGSVVVKTSNGTDKVLINGYGRIKTSGQCKDINGDKVSVNKDTGIATIDND